MAVWLGRGGLGVGDNIVKSGHAAHQSERKETLEGAERAWNSR